MTKTLYSSEDKIQEISNALKNEVLEPAHAEAEEVVTKAKSRAEHLIEQAHRQADELLQQAHAKIEKEKGVFTSSLIQASKQALETLRQSVERDVFNTLFSKEIEKGMKEPDAIGKLLKALVESLQKEGIHTDIEALIPKEIDPEEVARHIGEKVLDSLKNREVTLGDFSGGVRVKLANEKITIDISDETLKNILLRFVRKDFRALLFKQEG